MARNQMLSRSSPTAAGVRTATTSKSTTASKARWRQSKAQSFAEKRAARKLVPIKHVAEHWNPHRYQTRAVKFVLERRSAALFLDPGLGKTSITYAAIRVLKQQGLHEGTIVVAPRRPAVMVWRQEQERWKEFSDLKVGLVHGKGREEVWDEPLDVYITTYEGLQWLIKTGRLKAALRANKVRNIVFDELSKMKNTKTLRFKSLKPFLHLFDRRWGLTGSPAANGLMDLFGECFTLDLGRALGKYITHYRFQYFDAFGDQMHPQFAPKPGAEEAIFARIASLALRIDAADHLELPKLIPHRISIELPPEAREKYDEMEDQFLVEIDKQIFTAQGAAALGMKCRQLASGALYEDLIDPETGVPRAGKRKYTVLHDEKLDALDDLIDELQGQQLFVGYYFGHDRERILARLGKDTPCIGGGTSDKKALEYEEAWNNGWISELLGHPSSVGHGLNFQRSSANQIAIFSPTWNYEEYDQFIRRLLRQGNKSARIMLHQFCAKNTVEELVYIAMHRKGALQNRLHDALKNFRHTRQYTGLLA
jgi:SNF2 family DNA or RNA helicase